VVANAYIIRDSLIPRFSCFNWYRPGLSFWYSPRVFHGRTIGVEAIGVNGGAGILKVVENRMRARAERMAMLIDYPTRRPTSGLSRAAMPCLS
jgi:hypothetical protein